MVNKVILIGNVGQDPDVRSLDGGIKVARVRMATTERIYNQATNERKEHTEWHTITLWRGLADVVDRYVRKGSQIYIEGKIRTREWVDRDNQKHTGVEILADDLKLLGRKSDNPTQGQYSGGGNMGGGNMGGGNSAIEPAQPTSSYTPPQTEAVIDDELPF